MKSQSTTIHAVVCGLVLVTAIAASGQNGFVNPLVDGSYKVAQGFKGTAVSKDLYHLGQDFCVQTASVEKTGELNGTIFYPISRGKVIDIRFSTPAHRQDGVGNYIAIDHGNGIVAFYMHLAKVFVSRNDTVDVNTPLGEAGDVVLHPKPNCAHLHLEMRKDGTTGLNVPPNLRYSYVAKDGKDRLKPPLGDQEEVLKWIDAHFIDPLPILNDRSRSDPPSNVPNIPTLFLFDVSGSMADNGKIDGARAAGLDALREMRDGGAANAPVSIMTFSGDQCGGNVTKLLLPFTNGTLQAENVMRTQVGPPNGGTPLPQAKDAAWARITAYMAANTSIKEGRIILLSDGQSTCGEIRPPGVYSQRMDYRVDRAGGAAVKFFTIGFDVPAGSVAERDLQFLASETGGKYYNAANREQLMRALKKQVRQYLPKVCSVSTPDLAGGLRGFADSDYAAAADAFRRYTTANPADLCGLYDLALAYEANDRYKKAGENYQRYLAAAPSAPDRLKVEAKIVEMRSEYAEQVDYLIQLIGSDKDYLGRFYTSIFNRSSMDLGEEFGGFVYEKGEFYANLSDILEIDEHWLLNDAKDISASLGVLNRRRKMESFDRDAVSLLTTPIAQIEDMLDRLTNYRRSKIR